MNTRRSIANQYAQSMIEVTIGIVVLIPVALILIDLGVMLFSVELNDTNCRNAARAAAAGVPEEATLRAETAIPSNARENQKSMVTNSHLILPVDVKIVSRPGSEKDIAAEKQIFPGGPIIGTTTVTTEIEVRPMLVHMLYGGKLPILFRATHSFPISYTQPAS